MSINQIIKIILEAFTSKKNSKTTPIPTVTLTDKRDLPNTGPKRPIPITPQPEVKKGWLACPIQKDGNGKFLNSRTIRISSVVDHSGTAIDPENKNHWGKRAKDKKVKAFNGEIGNGQPSAETPYGYTKENPSPFFSAGEINYVGAPSEKDQYEPKYYLNYDGHAGYDFPYPKMTPVVAPAKGRLKKCAPGEDFIYGSDWNTDHSFRIIHENGYMTWFRHCEKLSDDIETEIGADLSREYLVEKGRLIAYVGTVGTWSTHLHLEVRDKKGNIVDPYAEQLWEN